MSKILLAGIWLTCLWKLELHRPKYRILELDEAFAENLLGSLYMRKKQFEVALSHFNRALELRQKNENRVGVAGTLGSIGEMYENANELQKAEEYSFKALAIAEEAGFALGKCYTYLSIGQLYLKKHE